MSLIIPLRERRPWGAGDIKATQSKQVICCMLIRGPHRHFSSLVGVFSPEKLPNNRLTLCTMLFNLWLKWKLLLSHFVQLTLQLFWYQSHKACKVLNLWLMDLLFGKKKKKKKKLVIYKLVKNCQKGQELCCLVVFSKSWVWNNIPSQQIQQLSQTMMLYFPNKH